MQKSSLTTIVAMALTLIAGQVTQGQSAYFQAVTNLNPAGYWPLNETAQPPQPLTNVANNLGTYGCRQEMALRGVVSSRQQQLLHYQ